jgi:hypothetical protein
MRTLREIAKEIKADWAKPYYGAVPYLNAMAVMNSVDDNFHGDNGRSVVLYFLANASTWRGEVARRIKKELNQMVK